MEKAKYNWDFLPKIDDKTQTLTNILVQVTE